MKKILIPVVAIFVLAFAACNGTGYSDPVKYNDDVVTQQSNVYDKLDSLETILNDDVIDEEACEGAFKDAIAITDAAIKKLEEMGAYKDDATFQKAGIDLFTQVKSLLENDYRDLYELYKKPIEDWEDADFDSMYDIWDAIDYGIIDKEDAFLDAQQNFADTYNIVLY
ncbi:MAG: hypothetical protein JXL97_18680 [Bacteroidales bacterium]|nr:hypothetical protein [Bacteroidales bacterium]